MARHLIGHHPLLNRLGVEQGTVDTRTGRADMAEVHASCSPSSLPDQCAVMWPPSTFHD